MTKTDPTGYGGDADDSSSKPTHTQWRVKPIRVYGDSSVLYAQILRDSVPVGKIRCYTEEDYKWIVRTLTGTQRLNLPH